MSSPLVSPAPPSSNGTPSTYHLPYGYQIDLDFIRYCENLNNVDPTTAELQRRHRRRQRQSMEVMLGIQLEMQQQMNESGEFWDKKPPEPPVRTHSHHVESPIVPKLTSRVTQWDPALSDVVSDFEKTLERSKKGKEIPTKVVVKEINLKTINGEFFFGNFLFKNRKKLAQNFFRSMTNFLFLLNEVKKYFCTINFFFFLISKIFHSKKMFIPQIIFTN